MDFQKQGAEKLHAQGGGEALKIAAFDSSSVEIQH
jgi:hypothetical protein